MIYGLGLWCKDLSRCMMCVKSAPILRQKDEGTLKGVAEPARPSVVTPDSETLP